MFVCLCVFVFVFSFVPSFLYIPSTDVVLPVWNRLADGLLWEVRVSHDVILNTQVSWNVTTCRHFERS